ncbi:MAG TPA: glutamine synthetase family protein [Acidimicrobiales bacterium]|nr:glutamine synthetase family protein [Acidimicrobiales bacterium]
MTPDELADAVASGSVDTVILGFPDLYGRLLGKRVDAGFLMENLSGGTHVCDYLFTVDMEMEPVEGYAFSNWEAGYGDVHLVPDRSTIRVLSWLDRTAFIMCDAEDQRTHELVSVAPRSILKRQIARLHDMGHEAMAASELEYYLYRTSYREAAVGRYRDLDPAGWYIEDYHLLQGSRTEDLNGAFRRHLGASEIPVESTKGEFGRGQHELNIRYADVLAMADRHILMKQCVKEVADQQGASATFMAKVDETEAGSSSHLHLSLWSGDVPLFPGGRDLAGVACSEVFEHFLAGWMEHAPALMACMAPTVNSYKRYQAQSWAPTAMAWSPDNRTAGFRVVGHGPGLRIECRIPGADVNPYLAYAAAIAAGLDGLERASAPPPAVMGDLYTTEGQHHVPTSLREAADAFETSTLARAAFGSFVVDHYAHFFRTEVAAAERAVTDWERVRYFERI